MDEKRPNVIILHKPLQQFTRAMVRWRPPLGWGRVQEHDPYHPTYSPSSKIWLTLTLTGSLFFITLGLKHENLASVNTQITATRGLTFLFKYKRPHHVGVTRFDEIFILWQNCQSIMDNLWVHLVFGKILNLRCPKSRWFWANFYCCK